MPANKKTIAGMARSTKSRATPTHTIIPMHLIGNSRNLFAPKHCRLSKPVHGFTSMNNCSTRLPPRYCS